MIDKKKATILGVIAIVIIGVLIGGIFWAYNRSSTPPVVESSTPTSSETPSSTNSASTSPSAEPSASSSGKFDGLLSFDKDKETLAANAAIAAAKFSSPESDQARQNGYNMAGFSPELAKSFDPVWADIYDPEKLTSLTVEATLGRVWLSDATGTDKEHTYRVGVLLNYKVNWMKRSGGAAGQPEAEGTWWVTMNEKTGEVTKIDQPTKAELNVDLSK